MAIFSSMAAIGFTAGVILGGILTSFISRHWVSFVNVPTGVLAIIAALALALWKVRVYSRRSATEKAIV